MNEDPLVVPRLGFWVGLVVMAVSAGFMGASWLHRPSQPESWASVSLRCRPDLRVAPNKTAFGGDLPDNVIYISEIGQTVTTVGQPPLYDPRDRAMFQLSEEDFIRCVITNDGPQPLQDVTASFYTDFVGSPNSPTPPVHPNAFAHTESIAAGGAFNFGLANFGQTVLVVRGDSLNTAQFTVSLSALRSDISTRNMISGFSLDPQLRKPTPWVIPTGRR